MKQHIHFYQIESTHFTFHDGKENRVAIVVCRKCGKVKMVEFNSKL